MNTLSINTPQNVRFDYKLATLGARMIAFAIDYFLIICYSLFVYYLLQWMGVFKHSDFWLSYGIYMLLLLPCFFLFLFDGNLLSGANGG